MNSENTELVIRAKNLYDDAIKQIKKQDFISAEKLLTDSLNIYATPDCHHNLGTLKYLQGEIPLAIQNFQSAINLDPNYDEAYANLMRIMHQSNNLVKAIEYASMAIKAAPNKHTHKVEFITLISGIKFHVFNPEIKHLITLCLEENGLEYDKIQGAWASILSLDPEHASIFKLSKYTKFPKFEKKLHKLKHLDSLNSKYFTLGLKKLVVGSVEFETLLTNIRRAFLKDFNNGLKPQFLNKFMPFIQALSFYCLYTEYVFYVSNEEERWIKELEEIVENNENSKWSEYALCLLACYIPIYKLNNKPFLLDTLKQDSNLDAFWQRHLYEPHVQDEIKKSIISLTEIKPGTSQEVQEQYEEFPYPRWTILQNTKKPDFVAHISDETPIKILVAGCGTGREALTYAKVFPQAEILAVDLSKASLAYAIMKAKELDIKNVTFRQADILMLETILKPEYDIVISCGVLVTMNDPEAGLTVIKNLLKADGYMNLALYSEIARKSFVAGQNAVIKYRYKNDKQGIRSFRKNINKLLRKKDIHSIVSIRDYYFMSECRDLLFHVMERRITIPQLNEQLKKSKLKFIGFINLENIYSLYDQYYKNDPQRLNLENWHELECKNPDIFRRMYQFWVKHS